MQSPVAAIAGLGPSSSVKQTPAAKDQDGPAFDEVVRELDGNRKQDPDDRSDAAESTEGATESVDEAEAASQDAEGSADGAEDGDGPGADTDVPPETDVFDLEESVAAEGVAAQTPAVAEAPKTQRGSTNENLLNMRSQAEAARTATPGTNGASPAQAADTTGETPDVPKRTDPTVETQAAKTDTPPPVAKDAKPAPALVQRAAVEMPVDPENPRADALGREAAPAETPNQPKPQTAASIASMAVAQNINASKPEPTRGEAKTDMPRIEVRWPAANAANTAGNGPANPTAMTVTVAATQQAPLIAMPGQSDPGAFLRRIEREVKDISLGLTDSIDSQTNPGRTIAQTVATRADLSAAVARQIAQAMQAAPDRAIELTLSPAELGRVRMSLGGADQNMIVSIFAERPETLDLMRRNIDMLNQAMLELGYTDVTFAFEQGQQGETATGDEQGTDTPDKSHASLDLDLAAAPPAETLAPALNTPGAGLDLRL